jgi:hypothetical protein
VALANCWLEAGDEFACGENFPRLRFKVCAVDAQILRRLREIHAFLLLALILILLFPQ